MPETLFYPHSRKARSQTSLLIFIAAGYATLLRVLRTSAFTSGGERPQRRYRSDFGGAVKALVLAMTSNGSDLGLLSKQKTISRKHDRITSTAASSVAHHRDRNRSSTRFNVALEVKNGLLRCYTFFEAASVICAIFRIAHGSPAKKKTGQVNVRSS